MTPPKMPEPMNEPIAWMVTNIDGQDAYVTADPTLAQRGQRALPLYTAPAPVPQWQPIEAAPRDGFPRLFRVNGVAVQGFKDATGVMCVQNERLEWRRMRGQPTHWMPLPEPPEGSKP